MSERVTTNPWPAVMRIAGVLRRALSTATCLALCALPCLAGNTDPIRVTPSPLVPGGQATVHYEGRFADKPNLTIHYGFNGWNHVDGVDDLQVEDDDGNENFFKQVAMTKVPGTGFRVTIDVPDDARALHYVFYFNDDGRKRWDNNQRLDYRATVTIPYMGPYLTWNDSTAPHNGVVINYQTATPVTSRVEYGTSPSMGMQESTDQQRTSHHLELTGLEPNTTYHYRVHGSNDTASPIYSFKTAPDDVDDFTFAVTADMQDNGDNRRWKEVADELENNHSDVAFILVVGDMPWNDQPGHWWTFFDKGRQLLASKVMMPAAGNHDTPGTGSNADTTTFEELFDLPKASGSETFYTFRFAKSRFLCLNSERPRQFRKASGTQYRWTRDQLADDVLSQWRFVYWHIPPYDAAERHFREQGKLRDMTELFDENVDWVFGGHEHLYQRFKPLRYNANVLAAGLYGNGPEQGVGYLVVPPAGNHPASQIVSSDSPVRRYRDRLAFPPINGDQSEVDSEIGFTKVSIAGDGIEIRTFGMGTLNDPTDSRVIDSVSYTK